MRELARRLSLYLQRLPEQSVSVCVPCCGAQYNHTVADHALSTQLKGSELEITLTKGSCVPGPACAYVNLNICANGTEQGGVLLLENTKGDNQLNLVKLKTVVTSVFGVKNAKLSVFHGETGMWGARGHLVICSRWLRGLHLVSTVWQSRGLFLTLRQLAL